MSDQLTDSLKSQRNDQGQVRIWDVHLKKFVYVWPPDAREMIERNTGSLSKPEDAPPAAPAVPVVPVPPSTPTSGTGAPSVDVTQLTADQLLTMEGTVLLELAVREGVKNVSKLSREQLIEAIAKKHGIELD